MPDVERFDTVILGSGQGGKSLAWALARSGRRVAVVERRWVGGSCPAVACMPSKNELWSARVAHLVRHAAEFGTTTGKVETNMRRVLARKQAMVEREIALHIAEYDRSGAVLIMGSAQFIAPRTLEVQLSDGDVRVLSGEQVVINVGTHPAIPAVPGLEEARALTHIEALELDYVPPHLLVLGGGYVAMEFAQAYRRFGSRVTVITTGSQLLSREDCDVGAELYRVLSAEDVTVVLGAEPTYVRGRSGDGVTVSVRRASEIAEIEASDLMIAAGRVPNTAHVGLELAGVELDARGYIEVNDRLETTAPRVWAIGECAGSPQFTHVSVDDARIVKENMSGGDRSTRDRLTPYVLFTDPPLAHVGLTEREAKRLGIAVRVAKLEMSSVLRTQATSETAGFMKVLVSQSDDVILGFTMIGSEAGEVMSTVQCAMLAQLPYQRLRDAVVAHLTMTEGLGRLLSTVPPRAEPHR